MVDQRQSEIFILQVKLYVLSYVAVVFVVDFIHSRSLMLNGFMNSILSSEQVYMIDKKRK